MSEERVEEEKIEGEKFIERPLITIKLETLTRRYASGELGRDEYEVLASYMIEEELEVMRLIDQSTWKLFLEYIRKELDIVMKGLPHPELMDAVRDKLKEHVKEFRKEVFGRKLSHWTDRDLEENIEKFVSGVIFRAGLATLKDLGYVK